jgi:hypothetical protein
VGPAWTPISPSAGSFFHADLHYGERWAPAPLLRRIAESGGLLREAKAPILQG